VVTATERALFEEGAADEVVVESVDVAASRPHGKRFGTLVHAVLAAVELDADRAGWRMRRRCMGDCSGRRTRRWRRRWRRWHARSRIR
jgi:hypothetical protein